MINISCIIIDDEPMARKGMEEYVAAVDFLEFKASFGNPLEAVESGMINEKQLLLMDIGMPGISGIELLKLFDPRPPVIFTTAYPQHAVEGFELNAIDYLVKPIPLSRFVQAAMKARAYFEQREKQQVPEPQDHFFIKADNKLVRIILADILFVEALQNYVVIHTSQKKYITYLTFKAVEEYLNAARFVRTHKSYIVAADRIESIEGNEIRIGAHHIPISRTLKDEVMAKLLNGKYLKR